MRPCTESTIRLSPVHLSPIRPCAGIKKHEKLWTAVLPALSGHSHVIHTQFFYSLAISVSLFSSSSLSSYFRRKNGSCLCSARHTQLRCAHPSPLIAPSPSRRNYMYASAFCAWRAVVLLRTIIAILISCCSTFKIVIHLRSAARPCRSCRSCNCYTHVFSSKCRMDLPNTAVGCSYKKISSASLCLYIVCTCIYWISRIGSCITGSCSKTSLTRKTRGRDSVDEGNRVEDMER